MLNSVYNVNGTNNRFRLLCRTGNTNTLFEEQFFIPIGNYPSKRALATAFADALRGVLFRAEQAGTDNLTSFQINADALRPKATSATDLLLVQLDTRPAAADHGLSQIVVQCLTEQGDAYQLFGGERVDDSTGIPEGASKSFKTTENPRTLRFEGFFPMQLQTESTVYLRTDCSGSNLESSILSGTPGMDSSMISSNILGKVQKDEEFIFYEAPYHMPYFINLQQKRLTSLRLFLTDSKGRKLGRIGDNGTASGLSENGVFVSNKQSTLGNLFFNCVIRADIIKVRELSNLQTTPVPPMLPARIAQAPYTVQDYGRPKH